MPVQACAALRRSEEPFRSIGALVFPEEQKSREDLALGVEPSVGPIAGAHAQKFLRKRRLKEGFHLIGRVAQRRQPGAVAHGFELTAPVGVEFFVAKGLPVGGLTANAEPRVAPELLLGLKPVGGLDEPVKEVRSDRAHARHLLELLDLRIASAETKHLGLGLFLRAQGGVEDLIEPPQPRCDAGLVEPSQIGFAPVCRVEALPFDLRNPPAAEGRLKLLFEGDLLLPHVDVMLNHSLEDRAVVIGGLIDGLQLAETEQTTERVGVGLVALASVPADERVLPRVAHEDLIHVGIKQASGPSGQAEISAVALFEREPLRAGLNRNDARNQLRLGSGKLLVAPVGAIDRIRSSAMMPSVQEFACKSRPRYAVVIVMG